MWRDSDLPAIRDHDVDAAADPLQKGMWVCRSMVDPEYLENEEELIGFVDKLFDDPLSSEESVDLPTLHDLLRDDPSLDGVRDGVDKHLHYTIHLRDDLLRELWTARSGDSGLYRAKLKEFAVDSDDQA